MYLKVGACIPLHWILGPRERGGKYWKGSLVISGNWDTFQPANLPTFSEKCETR